MFIQTAYGLEGALPGRNLYDITHNVIAPYFKRNDYAGGLKAGVTAMIQGGAWRVQRNGPKHKEASANDSGGRMPIGLSLFSRSLCSLSSCRIADDSDGAVTAIADRVRPYIGGFGSGGGWSGGSSSSSGGGFSGFSGGGGSFGGGGAGSSW